MIMDKENKIIKTIKKYDYVSFDVFDTLLKRNIAQPSDIFKLIQQQGKIKFGSEADNFALERKQSEARLRKEKNLSEEITLKEIYQDLNHSYSSKFLNWAYNYELELEMDFANPNYELQGVYEYCVKNNKKIQIITDIYLPKAQIVKMLNKIGISEWDHIWVSSSIKKTKAKGDLFDYVLERLQIKGNQLVHIGDNVVSDYKNPQKRGIRSIKIETYNNNLCYSTHRNKESLDDNIITSFMNNNVLSIKENQRVGFETLGPLLYGFNKWLMKELQQSGIDEVFFLSRDGRIIKKAFDLMNNSNIRSHYFYASRRAFQVPTLAYNLQFSSFIKRVNWPERVSLRYFLKSVGIEKEEELSLICKKYKLPLNFSIQSCNLKSSDNLFRKIFENEKDNIERIAKNEKKLLYEYIEQSGLNGKVAIIDIGWHGNMQMNLVDILKREKIQAEVYGFYMGVDPFINHKEKIRMSGYLFDDERNINLYKKVNNVIDVFEQSFMAPHGSVKKYKNSENKIVPVLYPMEQSNNNNIEFLLNFQLGALEFVKSINGFNRNLDPSLDVSAYGIVKLFTRPRYSDAVDWGHLNFKNIKIQEMVIKTRRNYLIHPRSFLTDYNSSIWKEGFLKQTLKLNLDYYNLIRELGKIKRSIL